MKEEKQALTINGKSEQEFLSTYLHPYESVEAIGLEWKSLVELYDHYCKYVRDDLALKAPQLHEELLKVRDTVLITKLLGKRPNLGTEGQILFQIEYEQLDNKEVKECLGKLENHQELVYIT